MVRLCSGRKMDDDGLSVVRNTAEHRRTTRAKLAKNAGTKKCLICFHLKSEQALSLAEIGEVVLH